MEIYLEDKYLILNYLEEFTELKEIYKDHYKWKDKQNTIFKEKEKNTYKNYFDKVEDNPLTEMQREAVITNDNANLVLAGAGSGKTSVIVAKVGYLLEKKLADSKDIIVLAFNKDARKEIKERIKSKLHNPKITVKTFHSLGKYLLTMATLQKQYLAPWTNDDNTYRDLIRSIIDERLKKDINFTKDFILYFTKYYAPYKNYFDFKTEEEYNNYISTYELRTLKGVLVKSFEELQIANFLTLHSIDYQYEIAYKEEPTATLYNRVYLPDFYLPDFDIYIEHYGIDRNNKTAPFINNKKYLAGIKWKDEIHKKNNTTLIKTHTYDRMEGKLFEVLKKELEKNMITLKLIKMDEAINILNTEHGLIDNFVNLFKVFLDHYYNGFHKIEKLKTETNDKRTLVFIELFEVILKEYENKKQHLYKCIDFNDMIIQAIKHLSNQFQYKYILVDEFQDISQARFKLILELHKLVENSSLTVVGDDWQAINRFAGSDISIIKNFKKIFKKKAQRIDLDYTFRFDNQIAEVSSQFITQNNEQMKKTILTTKISKRKSINIFWNTLSNSKDISYLEQIFNLILKKNNQEKIVEVMILGRYGFNNPSKSKNKEMKKIYTELCSKYSNKLKIKYSTVHSSKGLGKDYVILLDVHEGRFGFPSNIQNDSIIDFITKTDEDYLHAEERRLFYVALTRTKNEIFLVSHPAKQSLFIKELLKDYSDKIIVHNENKLKEIQTCRECGNYMQLRKTNNELVYLCNNTLCSYSFSVRNCIKCNTILIKDFKRNKAICYNSSCNEEYELCKCNNGIIRTFQNRNTGKYFQGCTEYKTCNF